MNSFWSGNFNLRTKWRGRKTCVPGVEKASGLYRERENATTFVVIDATASRDIGIVYKI